MPGTDRRLEKGSLSLSAEVTMCLFNPSRSLESSSYWIQWHCWAMQGRVEAAASERHICWQFPVKSL